MKIDQYLLSRCFYYLIFLSILTSCCDAGLILNALVELTDCDNPIIQKEELSSEALNFVPYQEGGTLIFKNEVGDSAIFDTYNNRIKKERIARTEHCNYYETNIKSSYATSINRMGSSDKYYELNFTTRFKLNEHAELMPQTSIRFSENSASFVNDLIITHNQMPSHKNLTLLSYSFENVFVNQDRLKNIVYFIKGIGVVGFVDFDGIIWVLVDQ